MQPPINSQRRVILMGASIRAAAESAAKAGWKVYGIDLFGDQDTRAVCSEFRKISQIRPQNEALQAAQEAWPEAKIAFAGDFHQEGNQSPHRSNQAWKTPDSIFQIVNSTGRCSPYSQYNPTPQSPSFSAEELLTKPVQSFPGRLLVKPIRGTGGIGIKWADRETMKTRKVQPNQASTHFLQPWVQGRPYGFTFYSDGQNTILLGGCRSMTTHKMGSPFVYAGSVGPMPLKRSTVESVEKMGQAYCKASNHVGLFNIDVILRNKFPPCLLEINPRWSASMEVIEQSNQAWRKETEPISLMDHQLNQRSVDSLPPVIHGSTVVWKRILYSKRDGFLDSSKLIKLQQRCGSWNQDHDAHYRFADLPLEGQNLKKGEPLMTMLVRYQKSIQPHTQSIRCLIAQAKEVIVSVD